MNGMGSFKVGDFVVILPKKPKWVKMLPGYTNSMEKFAGKRYEISEILIRNKGIVRLEDADYSWNIRWLKKDNVILEFSDEEFLI